MSFRSTVRDEDTIGKLTRAENILFAFAFFACVFMAPGPAASVLLLLFLWWARLLLRKQSAGAFESEVIRPLLAGTAIGFVLTAAGSLAGLFAMGAAWGLWHESLRMAAKLFLWGLISIAAMGGAYRRGFSFARQGKLVLVLAGVTLGYLVLQRYTGVDWVGGLSKCIPESRFAYGVYRPNGWMGHPLSLGFNLMLVTVVAWMRGFHATSRHDPEKRFWRILFTVAAISLLLNQSRWPIAVALGLIAVTSLGKLKKSPKTVILIFCLGVAGVFGDPALRGRLSEVVTNPQQLLGKGERAGFWNVHAKMFRDHLLLGVGYHRRKSASLDYYNRAGYTNNEKKYAAHNIYLQILADSGLVGFLGFLSLMAGLALTAWRQLQGGKPALLTLLAAAMLGGLMQNNFRDSEFLYCFWMLVAVCLAQARIPEKEIAP